MVELRKHGLITAVICSVPFEKLGRSQARVLGVPDLPLIMIPHPLGGIGRDQVQARSELVIPRFVDLVREHLK